MKSGFGDSGSTRLGYFWVQVVLLNSSFVSEQAFGFGFMPF